MILTVYNDNNIYYVIRVWYLFSHHYYYHLRLDPCEIYCDFYNKPFQKDVWSYQGSYSNFVQRHVIPLEMIFSDIL